MTAFNCQFTYTEYVHKEFYHDIFSFSSRGNGTKELESRKWSLNCKYNYLREVEIELNLGKVIILTNNAFKAC